MAFLTQLDLTGLRLGYGKGALLEPELRPDPVDQFAMWFEEVHAAGAAEPNAMALATVSASGRPSVRMVLLKGFDAAGFVWYTNYSGRKGRELDFRPEAALLFYWPALERQVRIDGTVERVSEAESDAYFATRPRGHQLSAWASPQSAPVSGRDELERLRAAAEARFAEVEVIPRPPFWGGYRLRPEGVEFWQGRADRLHDRVEYRREDDRWKVRRLAP